MLKVTDDAGPVDVDASTGQEYVTDREEILRRLLDPALAERDPVQVSTIICVLPFTDANRLLGGYGSCFPRSCGHARLPVMPHLAFLGPSLKYRCH